MKRTIKLMTLLLVVLMLLPMIASCAFFQSIGNPEQAEEQSTTADPSQDLQLQGLTAEQKYWRTVLMDASSYMLVRPAQSGTYDARMALVLQAALQSLSSALVRVYTDDVKAPQDKEILFGETNRAGSAYVSSVDVRTLKESEYVIEYIGLRAIIHYGGFEGLVEAVREIIGYLVEPTKKDAEEFFDKMIKDVKLYPGNVALNNTYADGMIFQQNKPAVIKGTGEKDHEVVINLCNEDDQVVSTARAMIGEDGKWEATLEGQAGSYEKYKIRLTVLGITVLGLQDVVFGEVWIATGQSNMAYTTIKDVEFDDMPFDDEYVRVLQVKQRSSSLGQWASQPLADNENPQVKWYKGDQPNQMESMSSVAYFYSLRLREELNMPIGIIQYCQGGTPIRSWLSDETIQKHPDLYQHYVDKGYYVLPEDWDANGTAAYRNATALYNTMACLVEDFSVTGLIWYQGEQDLAEDAGDDKKGIPSRYLEELEIFYRQYCDKYGFENYDMPFIYSLLCPYRAASQQTYFGKFTAAFAKFAQTHENVSAIAIYDSTPYYNSDNTASHPNSKRVVGERMAIAALAGTYGKDDPASSPYPVSWKVENGAMIVTFENVSEGLMIHNGDGYAKDLFGFTICGSNGIYVMANAEIISANQIKVWSPYISDPVSVTYAYELLQRPSNLGCGKDGKVLYMAVPFCLDEPTNAAHTSYFTWMTCDFEKQWRMSTSGHSYCCDCDTWTNCTAENSGASIEISFDKENAYSGSSALRLDHKGSGVFGVCPTYRATWHDGKELAFNEIFNDYTKFSKLSFYVRNDGTQAVNIEGVRFKMADAKFASESDCTDGVIAADGEWHRIVLDLNQLVDIHVGVTFDNAYLAAVSTIQFLFEGTSDGTLLLDQFDWIP